jgi:DNA-directed RNA polymerase specialized sigma24 family protein
VQAEWSHDSIRHGLITMLPRLKRFADVLIGDKRDGRALLARSLRRMLAEQHRYQRGTPLDRWAFAEIYRLWLHELRDHADPMRQVKPDDQSFEGLFLDSPEEDVDALTASFLGNLPPQQRCTLLLVYGEGYDYEDAGRVLDSPPDTVAARLIRASASLADRLGLGAQVPASATIETLYPKGPQEHHDRTQ